MDTVQQECLSLNYVKCLSSFVEIVTEHNGKNVRGAIYRGQPNVNFKITSTLHRALIRKNPTTIERAKNGFMIFQRERHLYHEIGNLSGWDELCLAQHYGLPTRLIDWTLDPLTALYFALESIDINNISCDACVYMLPSKSGYAWAASSDLIGEPFGEVQRKGSDSEHIVLIPDYLNSRVRNQSGVFTLSRSITTEFPRSSVHKIVVAAKDIASLKSQLIQFGISRKKIYMDVEALCADIKDYHY